MQSLMQNSYTLGFDLISRFKYSGIWTLQQRDAMKPPFVLEPLRASVLCSDPDKTQSLLFNKCAQGSTDIFPCHLFKDTGQWCYTWHLSAYIKYANISINTITFSNNYTNSRHLTPNFKSLKGPHYVFFLILPFTQFVIYIYGNVRQSMFSLL